MCIPKLFEPILEICKHLNNISKKKEYYLNKKEKNLKIIEKKSKINQGKRGRIPLTDTKRRTAKDKITTLKIENHELDIKIRQLNKQYKEYKGYIASMVNIFNADTINEAKRRFNTLYNKRQFLPEEVVKFLNSLNKDLDATLSYNRK